MSLAPALRPPPLRRRSFSAAAVLIFVAYSVAWATEPAGPEAALRSLVRANAEKDLSTLSEHMAHDEDVVGYTIGGRKYVGWAAFEQAMREEFASAARLEIPITELKVWTRGDVAWFAMEIDYIRYTGTGNGETRTVIPLRETGVMERRDARWVLHTWHESQRGVGLASPQVPAPASGAPAGGERPDFSGAWQIEEEDKSYTATLDTAGNGSYSHQGGTMTTTAYANRLWQGTWKQPGNDREGGFEVLLSEDGAAAQGIWWYTRVAAYNNIPAREHGGTYRWKRMGPAPALTMDRGPASN
ncbi:MAG: YybH family protein [Gammaproteobacteria bacterium]